MFNLELLGKAYGITSDVFKVAYAEEKDIDITEVAEAIKNDSKVITDSVLFEGNLFTISYDTMWAIQCTENHRRHSEDKKLVPNSAGVLVEVEDTNELQALIYTKLVAHGI